MLAVTFALPAESSAFVRLLKGARYEGNIVEGYLPRRSSSSSADIRICVLHTGVGVAKCSERLRDFFRAGTPRLLVSSGFCGATRDDLKPGDVFIAENFSDSALMPRARRALPRATVGNLHSSASIVDSAISRYGIATAHGADAIDMESAVIAELCKGEGLPLLVARVVSDSPAAPFPAPPHVLFDTEQQRTKISRLVAHLARNPSGIARLAQFSKQIAFARSQLADALLALISELAIDAAD